MVNGPRRVAVVYGDPNLFDPVVPGGIWDDDDIETVDRLKDALSELQDYEFTYLDNHLTLIDDLRSLRGQINMVFNLCDEGFYNDPRKELHVAAVLELFGFPYTGATPQGMVLCLDKAVVKGIARNLGVPTAASFLLDVAEELGDVPIDFPVMVKPNLTDGGVGISRKSVCTTREELADTIDELRSDTCQRMPVLIEEFLPGKDLTIGMLGNPGFPSWMTLPIVEEDYSMLSPELPRICGYEAKWDPESPYWQTKSIVADLPDGTSETIVEGTKKVFTYTECRDYARFDWRLDAAGNPKLLDANPNPGWCWDGHLAKSAARVGITYPQMLERILEAAFERAAVAPEDPCLPPLP
jgi:D-alanine-D-alanine ligase